MQRFEKLQDLNNVFDQEALYEYEIDINNLTEEKLAEYKMVSIISGMRRDLVIEGAYSLHINDVVNLFDSSETTF